MINCAYIFKDNIEILLVRYSNLKNTFSSEDKWELFKDLDQFLYQFNKVIIDFLSQKYLIIAHLRVIVLTIKKDLEANRGEDYLLLLQSDLYTVTSYIVTPLYKHSFLWNRF